MLIKCAYCSASVDKPAGHVNRSAKVSAPLYCNMTCAGLGRRSGKSVSEKKQEKRLYDIEYRAKNLERIKADKVEWFKRTYDKEAAAVERKTRMPYHVQYCRQPAYKAKKEVYDRKRRATKQFGPFWEAHILLIGLENEVAERATKEELASAKGNRNKAQERKREYERTIGQQS